MTIQWALLTATATLSKRQIPLSYLDAELLLAFVLQKDRAFVMAHGDDMLSKKDLAAFKKLITKRAARMPLAYIVGEKDFYGLPFIVSRDTLIPRPDTEILIDYLVDYFKRHRRATSIIDVGTGSGCIPLSVAAHTKAKISITASDISPKALTIAKENAKHLGLSSRVSFTKKDLLKGNSSTYDVIVSNLPYLSKKEYAFSLKHYPEVKYEPKSALYGGVDGLDLIRILLKQAPKRLNKKGAIFLEIGYEQGADATDIATKYFPTADIWVLKDTCNRDRILMIQTK